MVTPVPYLIPYTGIIQVPMYQAPYQPSLIVTSATGRYVPQSLLPVVANYNVFSSPLYTMRTGIFEVDSALDVTVTNIGPSIPTTYPVSVSHKVLNSFGQIGFCASSGNASTPQFFVSRFNGTVGGGASYGGFSWTMNDAILPGVAINTGIIPVVDINGFSYFASVYTRLDGGQRLVYMLGQDIFSGGGAYWESSEGFSDNSVILRLINLPDTTGPFRNYIAMVVGSDWVFSSFSLGAQQVLIGLSFIVSLEGETLPVAEDLQATPQGWLYTDTQASTRVPNQSRVFFIDRELRYYKEIQFFGQTAAIKNYIATAGQSFRPHIDSNGIFYLRRFGASQAQNIVYNNLGFTFTFPAATVPLLPDIGIPCVEGGCNSVRFWPKAM